MKNPPHGYFGHQCPFAEEGPDIEIESGVQPGLVPAVLTIVLVVICLLFSLTVLSIGKGNQAPLPHESPTIGSVQATTTEAP